MNNFHHESFTNVINKIRLTNITITYKYQYNAQLSTSLNFNLHDKFKRENVEVLKLHLKYTPILNKLFVENVFPSSPPFYFTL